MKGEKMISRRIAKGLKMWLFLLSLVGLSVFIAWSSGTGSTPLCQKCHVMKPQSMTWSVSTHWNIPCVTCHITSNMKERIRFTISLIPKTYKTLTHSYTFPLHKGNAILNDACLQCHTPNRTVTPKNDIIIPHDRHYLNGVNCVMCHQGVAHGSIDERGRTQDNDFDKWTLDYAKKEMSLGNMRLGMKECMECHQNMGIGPVQCVGCHKTMITPDSHKNNAWEHEHGKEAVSNIEMCEKCHDYLNIEGTSLKDEEKNVAKYARQNSFCLDCHRKAVSPHEDGWAIWHSQSISRENANQCLVCHALNLPSYYAKTTRTNCSICHDENLGPAFRLKD